ncbi:hypothetical protein TNCV_3683201 [Trichonephila clavipes]|nr:hypothetical protein TNCV_3683201 [Trichonephila clavipes]
MKEGLIPLDMSVRNVKKDMRLVERKGSIDGFECRVQSKENPHFVCRSVRKDSTSSKLRLNWGQLAYSAFFPLSNVYLAVYDFCSVRVGLLWTTENPCLSLQQINYSGWSVNEHNPFQDYVRYPNCSLTDHRFTIDFYVKSINSFWRP